MATKSTTKSKAMKGKIVLKTKGKKPIVMKKGGLHQTTNTPAGQNIPQSKMQAALAGKYGVKGKKQAVAAQGLLKKGRATAAKNRAKKKTSK